MLKLSKKWYPHNHLSIQSWRTTPFVSFVNRSSTSILSCFSWGTTFKLTDDCSSAIPPSTLCDKTDITLQTIARRLSLDSRTTKSSNLRLRHANFLTRFECSNGKLAKLNRCGYKSCSNLPSSFSFLPLTPHTLISSRSTLPP